MGEIEFTPTFIRAKNKPVYRDWVTYWQIQLAKNELPRRGREPASRNSACFLDAIKQTSRENFILVDGGIIFDPVQPSEAHHILDHLFESLIADKESEPVKREFELLHRGWQKFVKKSGLKELAVIRESRTLRGHVGGVTRAFDFTAVLGNGTPEGALQKVIAGNQQSVNSASFMFEVIAKENSWKRSRFGSIVHATKDQLHEPEIKGAVAQLAEFSTILNVANIKDAVGAFRGMDVPKHGHS